MVKFRRSRNEKTLSCCPYIIYKSSIRHLHIDIITYLSLMYICLYVYKCVSVCMWIRMYVLTSSVRKTLYFFFVPSNPQENDLIFKEGIQDAFHDLPSSISCHLQTLGKEALEGWPATKLVNFIFGNLFLKVDDYDKEF